MSTNRYARYYCDQVGIELARVKRRTGKVHGNLKKTTAIATRLVAATATPRPIPDAGLVAIAETP